MYGEGNNTKLIKDIVNGLAGMLGGKLATGTGQQFVQQIPAQVSEQVNEETEPTSKIDTYLKDDIDE